MASTHRAEPGRAAASTVDLGAVVSGLLASPEWQAEERSSCAILHTPALRVVLTALHRGASLHNDDPDETVTVQGVRGEAVVSINGDGAVVDEGTLLGVPRGMPWRLVATTDSVVLLTVARA
jgi:quercetin dioxygenase-like cupin family protein